MTCTDRKNEKDGRLLVEADFVEGYLRYTCKHVLFLVVLSFSCIFPFYLQHECSFETDAFFPMLNFKSVNLFGSFFRGKLDFIS